MPELLNFAGIAITAIGLNTWILLLNDNEIDEYTLVAMVIASLASLAWMFVLPLLVVIGIAKLIVTAILH